MTTDTLLLIGREAATRDVYESHAERLRRRGVADSVRVATYDREPRRELHAVRSAVDTDRTYAVPLALAHTNQTTGALPAALSGLPGDVRYCEPVGRSPSLTRAIRDRATAGRAPDDETTLALVAFGNTNDPYHRQVVDYHAARLRDGTEYADVLASYLVQNPTVECVRYNVATEHAVAVPLFVSPSDATETEIPEKLEVDRGGVTYADPLGTHPAVTDAIHDRLETQRVLAESSATPASFEGALTHASQPLATDGEGPIS